MQIVAAALYSARRADMSHLPGQDLNVEGAEATRLIHHNDTDRLRALLAAHPALVSWRDANGTTLLAFAAESYGDSGDEFRERSFTRLECAEILIDAGAKADRAIVDSVIRARARKMFELLVRKNQVPPGIEYLAARGDVEGIRRLFDEPGAPPFGRDLLDRAVTNACRFQHQEAARLLLDGAIELDPELGARIDSGPGRAGIVDYLCGHSEVYESPWQTYVTCESVAIIKRGDVAAFERWIDGDSELISERQIALQVRMIEAAVINGRSEMIASLYARNPAILRVSPPPSQAIEFAFEYAKTALLPLLTRIWPLPDDLRHAAGIGDRDRVTLLVRGGTSIVAARARRRAGMGGDEQSLRRRGAAAGARRRHQYQLELARARQHPPRAGVARELRGDAVPDRSRHRHDDPRLSLECHGRRMGEARREERQARRLPGGRGAAADASLVRHLDADPKPRRTDPMRVAIPRARFLAGLFGRRCW
jgi:hypothetical protein